MQFDSAQAPATQHHDAGRHVRLQQPADRTPRRKEQIAAFVLVAPATSYLQLGPHAIAPQMTYMGGLTPQPHTFVT